MYLCIVWYGVLNVVIRRWIKKKKIYIYIYIYIEREREREREISQGMKARAYSVD
jgi:hypothetical protein